MIIKAVYESICKALIRFFDNRFIVDDSIEYYRMELDKLRLEHNKLLEYVIAPKITIPEVIEDEEWKQARSGFKSWDQKRKELENDSRIRAESLAREARISIDKSKSTEQLEKELLTGTD